MSKQVARLDKPAGLDLAIFDLQIGSMGGMAVDDGAAARRVGRPAAPVPVLMLLDRVADVHLAQRCGADGWLIKPLDPLRLRRAAEMVAAGGTYTEGMSNRSSPRPIRWPTCTTPPTSFPTSRRTELAEPTGRNQPRPGSLDRRYGV